MSPAFAEAARRLERPGKELPTTGLQVANSGAPAATDLSRTGGELCTGFTTLAALSRDDHTQWRMLASQRPTSAPLVDAPWMRSWIEAFAPQEPVLLGVWDGRQLVGLAALQRVVESRGGCRLVALRSLTNDESFRFDILSWEGRRDVQEQMWRVLCDARRWDLVRLQHLPEDSPTLPAALSVARERGWRVVLRPTFLTPWRPLSRAAPWDYGLTRKFTANLRRRERRLAELGDVRFEVLTSGSRLRQALEVFYRLEANGWKGQAGSAIVQRPQVRRLYDRLVEHEKAGVCIPVLTVRGNPVAAQLLRVCGRIMFGLKTAYDQTFAKYGPGQLLTARVIRYGIEHGMEALDLMAGNAGYKADWARQFLPHHELLLFAPSLAGRYAYWARHGIQEQVKKVPGMIRLARWVRTQRT